MEVNLEKLRVEVSKLVAEHETQQGFDAILYNGSVIFAIAFSSAATFLSEEWHFAAKILSALTAIIIAIDRSLAFGARWIYHRQMRHDYLAILDRITLAEAGNDLFDDSEKKKYFMLIFDDLFALRKRESVIPGAEGVNSK